MLNYLVTKLLSIKSISRLDKSPLTASSLQFLLRSEVAGVSTGLLPAVGSPGMKPGIALPADHLVTVVLLSKKTEGGLDHSTPQPKYGS